jgi:hypothetical protein
MKSVRTILAIICLVASQLVTAQSSFPASYGRYERFAFEEADFLYFQGDYSSALSGFEKLYAVDSIFAAINHRIGACYIYMGKPPEKAIKFLHTAVAGGYEEAWFEFGLALHRLNRLSEARKAFEEYSYGEVRNHSPEELDRQLFIISNAEKLIGNPQDVQIYNLGPTINTTYPDYVPLVTEQDSILYFTSRRPGSTASLRDPDGNYFEDIYFSSKVNGEWGPVKNAGIPINSETHDATVSISSSGEYMLIYRTSENISGGDLFILRSEGGKWSKPQKIGPEINSEFQEASAVISPDGQTLIFSSNRPGGMGGKDLYRVKLLPNGKWSLPRNLGPLVNSPFDEDAPYISADGNTLYFASKGHDSMGGYDLFKSTLSESGLWQTPQNLGYPLNSLADDIYLCMIHDGKSGYFSSDRLGGFGNQDIYKIEFICRDQKNVAVLGRVLDESGAPLSATITLIDQESRTYMGEYRSRSRDGVVVFILNPGRTYWATITEEGYHSYSKEFSLEMSYEAFSEGAIEDFILLKK